jgi:Loader and inhibitor of phage G40P
MMNRKQVAGLLMLALSNFPNMQEKNMQPTAALWEKAFSDMDYPTAEKALIKVLSTSRFFPTVADIREAAAQINQPRIMDAMEAWGLIVQAIRKYGMYRQKEGLDSLPDDVRAMANRFTWRELCLNENPDTMRAQFRMAWETQSKRENEMRQIPQEIRQYIEGTVNSMKLLD